MKRHALAALLLAAACDGRFGRKDGGDEGLVKLLPQMRPARPTADAPDASTDAGAAAPAVPLPMHPGPPRAALRAMLIRRDPQDQSRDPWFAFSARPKSLPEIETLKAWAMDEGEERVVRDLVLHALHSEGKHLTDWWRARLPETKKTTAARTEVALGLLEAGGADAVSEVYALLGESDALDFALVRAADAGGHDEAVPLLRAYQQKKTAAPPVQLELTRLLARLDPTHAADDAETLLGLGDPETISATLKNRSPPASTLPLLLPRLGRRDLSERELDELRRFIIRTLHAQLAANEPRAVAVAEDWARPDPATRKLLDRVPAVWLVLGLWYQSRGKLARADACFQWGSASAGRPVAQFEGGFEAPEVAHAALLIHRACLLAVTGRRLAAEPLFVQYDDWSESMVEPVHTLLEETAFDGWDPEECYRHPQMRAAPGLQLSVAQKPIAGGLRLTLTFQNLQQHPISVHACPAPKKRGWLATTSVTVSLAGETFATVPPLACAPVDKKLKGGAALTGTLDVPWGDVEARSGLMRVSANEVGDFLLALE